MIMMMMIILTMKFIFIKNEVSMSSSTKVPLKHFIKAPRFFDNRQKLGKLLTVTTYKEPGEEFTFKLI